MLKIRKIENSITATSVSIFRNKKYFTEGKIVHSEKYIQSKRYSHIGMHSDSNRTYGTQFKKAFDTLYDSKDAVDTIALPMMYLARHYLEVTLKYYIVHYSKYSNTNHMVSSINSEHNLMKLADGFQQHWNSVVKKYNIQTSDKKYTSNLESTISLVKVIDKMDTTSMSFRYSHDKNDKKNFGFQNTLNIYEIKIMMDKSTSLFDYIFFVFYEQVGYSLELQEDKMLL